MTQDNSPLAPIHFHCTLKNGGCGSRFVSTTYQTEDWPERDWHPFHHYVDCPRCGEQAEQAAWELAAWRSAKVGKTAEGLAKISEANKKRDPASYTVSRFNAIVHGMTAETAKYYPARPGQYDACEQCEFLTDGCGTAFKHCAKRTELFVQFNLAMEEGNSALLGRLMASNQAALMAIQADMLRAVARRGVEIITPEYYTDKETGVAYPIEFTTEDGKKHRVLKVEANPLLPWIIKFMKDNGTTISDLSLTPAAQQEEKRFNGFLDAKEQERESVDLALEAIRTQQEQLQQLIRGGAKVLPAGRVIEGEASSDE